MKYSKFTTAGSLYKKNIVPISSLNTHSKKPNYKSEATIAKFQIRGPQDRKPRHYYQVLKMNRIS